MSFEAYLLTGFKHNHEDVMFDTPPDASLWPVGAIWEFRLFVFHFGSLFFSNRGI